MYKGNMQDFVERLDRYLHKEYGGQLRFGRVTINGLTNIFVAFFPKGVIGTQAYHIYDREDFEEQIYDYVNQKLKENVSREFDGLSD